MAGDEVGRRGNEMALMVSHADSMAMNRPISDFFKANTYGL